MHTYLGEHSSEYKSLVSESIVDNEIDYFDISNSRGEFKGYKVNKDNVQGYAYYHSQGDIYEFSPEVDCNVSLIEKQKITIQKEINSINANESIFKKRNDRTKQIQRYNIEFTGTDLFKQKREAVKANLNNENGFVFSKTAKHAYQANMDRTFNVFIPANNVTVLDRTSSYEMLSKEEIVSKKIDALKNDYTNCIAFLKNNNINIKDLSTEQDFIERTNYSINSVVNRIDKFIKNYNVNPFNKTYNDIAQLSTDIYTETHNQNILKEQKNLIDNFGFYIKATENIEEDQVCIELKNKDGVNISSLMLNNAFYNHKQVVGTDENENEVKTEVDFTTLDLDNNTEHDDKEVKVYENKKMIKLEESKFQDIFRIFDELAFTSNELVEEYLCDNVSNEYDESFPVATFDLTDKLSINRYLKDILKQESELSNKYSIKNVNKNKLQNN